MEKENMEYKSIIIWKKNHFNLSNSDYKSIYEPIFYGYNTDFQPILYGWNNEHKFFGKKSESDVIDFGVDSILESEKTLKNDLHPTMKPVSLLEKILNNSSKENDTVLDLFGGSGSTLIACEKKDRKCFMTEIEPKYIQVILKRFYKYTLGKQEIKCLNRDLDFSFLQNE